jgi:hypothetical protein
LLDRISDTLHYEDGLPVTALEARVWHRARRSSSGRRPARSSGQRGAAADDEIYSWLLLAGGHLTRRLFGSMLRRIAALPLLTG